MDSLHAQLWTRIEAMRSIGAPDSDPARREAISIEPHRRSALRVMESLHLRTRTRIGALNLAGTPGQPDFQQEATEGTEAFSPSLFSLFAPVQIGSSSFCPRPRFMESGTDGTDKELWIPGPIR